MTKVKISKLERIIGKKLKRNQTVFGVDTASRTGWAVISVLHDTYLTIDAGIITLQGIKSHNERFDYLLNFFDSVIKKYMNVVVEEPFVGVNRKTSMLLAKYSAIIYAVARYKGVKDITFVTATSARKKVGIRGKQKKKEGAIKFVHRFMPNLKSDDVSDGIILALVGLIQEPKLNNFLEKK